ncbi:hypothetical protein F5972_30040 [Microbispora cellulosiformans]|uniref:NYN domain-containing protein n=1 Tax=Microbispora cellulosiformans TaxID=2614688 RepID=A0A5J5JUF3_9ACTN|nr:hypothetical protein [Microbispora cellulosiformans]KAA9374845.1 hypothetical protein F5972_30040 [Microbispora cellulosiformans]
MRANGGQARALHVVDIENLVGAAYPTAAQAEQAMQAYAAVALVADRDHMIVGCSPMAARWVGWARPAGSRLVVRHGKDGADLALLEELSDREHIAARYGRVVIGSGDGIFAESAAYLAASCEVQVVFGAGALSRKLLMAVGHRVAAIEIGASALNGGVVA